MVCNIFPGEQVSYKYLLHVLFLGNIWRKKLCKNMIVVHLHLQISGFPVAHTTPLCRKAPTQVGDQTTTTHVQNRGPTKVDN